MTVYILPFEKMHALGNDFIMLEKRHLPNGTDENKLAKLLCNRNFGIGADGIIILDFPSTKDADFMWGYYNSDGSEAEMCGNGMRCFAKYVFEKGFTEEISFKVLTKAGIIIPAIESDGTVTVNMGKPYMPQELNQELIADSRKFTYTYVEIGNPHCVIFLKDKNQIGDNDFFKYGPIIEKHPNFPKGINVEFINILNKNEINCRVWERGAGPTLACGTGACASLVAANTNNLCDKVAKVHLPGGTLSINWNVNSKNVYLNGPATFVYSGQLNLDPFLISNQITKKSNG